MTFSMLVIMNILIRQVMINIVAIYMHNDYTAAKKKSLEFQKANQKAVNEKIQTKMR